MGVIQPIQYHEYADYMWGSKIQDDGSTACYSVYCANYNTHADTPREQIEAGRAFFNWYAAVAESGDYNSQGGGNNVSDSVCPSGWRLPVHSSEEVLGKSWDVLSRNMTESKYRQFPYNISIHGYRRNYDGAINNGETFYSTANGYIPGADVVFNFKTYPSFGIDYVKGKYRNEGEIVRCIQR